MSKKKFVFEYEINAPASMLFSYLTIPKSLKLWFAENVAEEKNDVLNFIWEGDDHRAKAALMKQNQFVKYEFQKAGDDPKDPSFIEFRIETNELTQTCFLKITDYYTDEDERDTRELWDGLMEDLKEVLGA